MTGKPTESQIVEELKQGDRLGCAHLLDAYQDRLTWEAEHVFHLLHEDAEEIVSDVLLSVVQGVHSFQYRRGEGDFHFWVMAVFRNRVRDFCRHKARSRGLIEYFDGQSTEGDGTATSTEREVVESILRTYQDSQSEEGGEDRGAGGNQALRLLAKALDMLQPWERVLLRCRALDISYDEISGYTGKNVGQLKVYHARVRKKLVRAFNLLREERVAT